MTDRSDKLMIPILMYHEIIDDNRQDDELLQRMKKSYFVKRSDFERQMGLISKINYETITLYDFIEYLDNPSEKILPPKSIIITFDDGYFGNFKYALPILKKFNLTATFFITVNYIGKEFMLGWRELMQLKEAGMSIQSHTMNHPLLGQLNDTSIKQELQDSKTTLENNLHTTVDFVSLPHGSIAKNYKQIAIALGYKGGCCSEVGLNNKKSDIYFLRRIHIPTGINLKNFESIIRSNGLFWKFIVLQKLAKEIVRMCLGEKLYKRIYDLIFNIKS